MRYFWPLFVAIVGVLTVPSQVIAADPPGFKALALHDAAPDFKLPGVDGNEYTLKSFSDARALLVIFTCNHCPTAQAYEARIAQLQADYQNKGVALVAISPNDPRAVRLDELGYSDLGDSFEDMAPLSLPQLPPCQFPRRFQARLESGTVLPAGYPAINLAMRLWRPIKSSISCEEIGWTETEF